MIAVIAHWFSWICGQNPSHMLAPGGVPLPVCERCVGFYAGVVAALIAFTLARPQLSARFMAMHALGFLAILPAGFQWVTEGPGLREGSGFCFGVATAVFLSRPLSNRIAWEERRDSRVSLYALLLAFFVVAIWGLGELGGGWAAWLLVGIVGSGVIILGFLVWGNLRFIAWDLWSRCGGPSGSALGKSDRSAVMAGRNVRQ